MKVFKKWKKKEEYFKGRKVGFLSFFLSQWNLAVGRDSAAAQTEEKLSASFGKKRRKSARNRWLHRCTFHLIFILFQPTAPNRFQAFAKGNNNARILLIRGSRFHISLILGCVVDWRYCRTQHRTKGTEEMLTAGKKYNELLKVASRRREHLSKAQSELIHPRKHGFPCLCSV